MKIIQAINDNLFAVMNDKYTKFIIKFKFRNIEYINQLDIFCCINLKNKYQILNNNGKIITLKNYDIIYDFRVDYDYKIALVKYKNKYGIIYKDGIEIVPCTYNTTVNFSINFLLTKIKQHERNLKLNQLI
jgi:hypothetical protein